MSMTEGQLYKCPDRDCGQEVRVAMSLSDPNPVCICGTGTKRPYKKPVMRVSSAPLDQVYQIGTILTAEDGQ
ncbi:MAG TPA: hypothetical protein VFF42_09400 [Candidatus Eremiobacteraceae bacterium]|nr:hypothetical protein [Candidatus Eremiobacteraceae bacterium]